MSKKRSQSAEELKSIGTMIGLALDEQLLTEVVWSFGIKRAEGMDAQAAASAALSEWDI